MKILTLIIASILLNFASVLTDTRILIEGNVIDATTAKTIPGAGIRIAGTNRGTYSSSKGYFRLSVDRGDKLIIRSLGYGSDSLIVKEQSGKLEFKLKPVPVVTENVDVTAAITPEQIIERAVQKRDENKQKLRTFSGELYSKLVMELDGSLLSFNTGEDGSVSMETAIGVGDEPTDSKQYGITETFSTVQKDYVQNISEVTINKRRQTANIPADQNIMAFTEFFSFYDDDVTFLKTTMPSPIGSSALSAYNFTLKERINQNDRYIYVLNVEPKSRIYPRFEGEVRIVEGTYNIVELELSPSSTTAIPFFEGIKIKQKYNESEEKVWYPAFLDVSATAKIEILKGVLDLSTDLQATSIFSDAKLNTALPDSFYTKDIKRRSITVSSLADTRDSLFWEQNSLRELSDREVEIYAKVDSAVKVDSVKATTTTSSRISYDLFTPHIDFNRVSSVSLGLEPSLRAYGFSLNTVGYFSFGLQDYFGSVQLELPSINIGKVNFRLSGDVYSLQDVFGHSIGQYHRLINTVAGAFGHEDYNDYYQNDGFGIDLDIKANKFNFTLSADFSRNFALNKTTDKSLFEDYEWRPHPRAMEGDFRVLRSVIAYGKIVPIFLPEYIDAEINIDAFGGQETNTETDFGGLSGRFIVSIPTFQSGYGKMKLMLSLSGGIVTDDTPVQYQHRMATRLFIINNVGNFFTAPLGFYGGDKYYSVQGLYNLSDIWWRWLGLPTYEGRGPELTIGGTYGEFYNNTTSFYTETGSAGYSEAGFGLSRIPTFVSNIIYWSFDVRFGIGPNAKGRTGGALSVTLPF
jgi:hypothetical protein